MTERSDFAPNAQARWLVALAVVATLIVVEADAVWWPLFPGSDTLPLGRTIGVLRIIVVLLMTWLLARRGLRFLGLAANPISALIFAVAATTPLWGVLAFTAPVSSSIDPNDVVFGSIFFPFSEEFFYRAFAFGVLYRVAGAPFWLAAVIPAIPFSLGHLYQADDMGSAIPTVAITFLGAVLFAWIYRAWNWNFYVPFFVHVLMNLWWVVFAVGDGAFAGWAPTAMQLGCCAMGVILSLLWQRRAARTA